MIEGEKQIAGAPEPGHRKGVSRALERINSLSDWLASGAALLLILISFAKVVEVILRGGFGISLTGLTEVLTLLTGMAVAMCLPAGFARAAHLRIDGLVNALPGRVSEPILKAGDILMLVFICILSVMVLGVAQNYAARVQTTVILGWPLAPFFYVIAAGFVLSVPLQIASITGHAQKAGLRQLGLALVGLCIAAILGFGTGLLDYLDGLVPVNMAFIVVGIMWVAMFLGVPLSAAMGLSGLAGLALVLNPSSAATVTGSEAASFLTSPSLAVLPLFLLMGALSTLAGLSSDIYRFANALLRPARAGLCHATIVACAGFGALTGSSLATAATFGRVAIPEMQKRNYSPALAVGSVAAGGTLGGLVPPSAALILYALLTEQSIGALFVAALVPAVIAIGLYMAVIALSTHLRPDLAPVGMAIDWAELRDAGKGCLGAAALFTAVIGGIYTGIFSDTEAASVGAAGAFLFCALRGKLKGRRIWSALAETTGTISLIYMLIFGAITFSFMLGFTGVPNAFGDFILSFDMTPIAISLSLVAAYLILGMVMDSYAMMVITAPIFVPLIISLGFDPIWWGIITVICVELGLISPPFGINLFVMRSVAPTVPLGQIWRGVAPFVAADAVKLSIVFFFPAILLS